MPRPSNPARGVPCPTCGAAAGSFCTTAPGRYHAARLRAVGLEPPASGPSGPSGHRRGHPERKRR